MVKKSVGRLPRKQKVNCSALSSRISPLAPVSIRIDDAIEGANALDAIDNNMSCSYRVCLEQYFMLRMLLPVTLFMMRRGDPD